jgi:CRISPR-associated protein (TIGR03986 family)
MSEPVKGIVTYTNKRLMISWMAKKGMVTPIVLERSVVRSKKVDAFAQSGSLDVLADLVGGRPSRVWCPDEKPPETAASVPAPTAAGSRGPLGVRYHNPYNFIPAIPRGSLPEVSGLSDAAPVGHDMLAKERWTGRLHVTMTAVTPLLIPDAAHAKPVAGANDGHVAYPIRVGEDGRPLVPPTSVKGMLRAAYEAVTNSRMGIFSGHEVPLGMRRDSHSGLDMVPARIVSGPDGKPQAELCVGTTEIDPHKHGSPLDPDRGQTCAIMYAAWLPSYHSVEDGVTNISRWKHGEHVESFRAVRKHHDRGAKFDYWRVVPDNYAKQDGEELKEFEDGWVCISGKNMPPGKRKHDERIFFNANGRAPLRLAITEEHRGHWKNLIEDYYHANENDIIKKGPCEYSRHIRDWQKEKDLKSGMLCYAAVDWQEGTLKLLDLYPVMISRDLQDASPDELLDASLKPASDFSRLSPADRVFGWVKDGQARATEQAAYRGNLRVGRVTCETADAIATLASGRLPGLPLSIMGQPKPEQARFYVAKDQQGTAQANGMRKELAIYAPGKGLRGRKVYPHQNVPSGYWEKPTEDRTQQLVAGWYQEYRRPRDASGKEQLDSQNRTMEAWVRPGALFSFDIDVTNLDDVELGALLWILSLGDNGYLKFGGGKPLGFGSVNLAVDWDRSQVGQGTDWAVYYSSLTAKAPPTGQQRSAELIGAYQKAVALWTKQSFEQVPFTKAFVTAARGYSDNLPTHYPRSRKKDEASTVPPRTTGEGFKWFSENEHVSRDSQFNGLVLPDLSTDRGLPYLEEYEKEYKKPQPR